ncbi:tetratricopeptide repeat protein [Cytobacillus sp. FJAT-54145]|uniref:Tetratricopeptide repeat protein n=1 Tax=Cytobacillus spartinae TaxID=3299023 RepID=A0ABW6KBB7_9BACI
MIETLKNIEERLLDLYQERRWLFVVGCLGTLLISGLVLVALISTKPASSPPEVQMELAESSLEDYQLSSPIHLNTPLQEAEETGLNEFYALWKNGKKEEAKAKMEEMLQLFPKSERMALEAAYYYYAGTQKPSRSIEILETFLTQTKSPYVKTHLSKFYTYTYKTDSFKKALTLSKQALDEAISLQLPELPMFYAHYAWALSLNNNTKDAIHFYQKKVFSDEASILTQLEARLNYGFTLEKAGQYENALKVYDGILTLDPNQVNHPLVQQELPTAQKVAQTSKKQVEKLLQTKKKK